MLPLLERLSNDLGLSVYTVAEIVRTAPRRYKIFTIKKRNGQPRVIAQPARIVKQLQRWLVEKELVILPVHDAATAYRSGVNIRTNAELHSHRPFLLKMDFSNFFPSIGDRDLSKHLKKYGGGRWGEVEIRMIANLVLWLPKRKTSRELCIGGPSSPLISNTLMYDFDCTVSEMCKQLGVVYSRYADDLAFSADKPDALRVIEANISTIIKAIEYPRLRLNEMKTVHSSSANLRKVTGLKITPGGEVSIGRERKREISAKMHHFVNGRLSALDARMLKGLIAFCLDVEPDFVVRLRKKYGSDAVTRLMSLPEIKKTRRAN